MPHEEANRNREIKFRALYEGCWYYQTLDEIISITLAAFRNGKHKTQYTGLKDKNGKEIYEGDIVETDHNPNSKPERLRRIVVYHDGSFRTQRSRHSSATDMNNMHSKKIYATNLIVIGNIYENPEMLETK